MVNFRALSKNELGILDISKNRIFLYPSGPYVNSEDFLGFPL